MYLTLLRYPKVKKQDTHYLILVRANANIKSSSDEGQFLQEKRGHQKMKTQMLKNCHAVTE